MTPVRKVDLLLSIFTIFAVLFVFICWAYSREGDDHGNHGALKEWFDGLKSGKGMCCSYADGKTVQDVDWDTGGPDGSYRVRLNGQWVNVPDEAVIKEPNRFGPAVVWPFDSWMQDQTLQVQIRCFIPGAGT